MERGYHRTSLRGCAGSAPFGAPASGSAHVATRLREIWAFGPPASGSAGCGLRPLAWSPAVATLPRRAPPPPWETSRAASLRP